MKPKRKDVRISSTPLLAPCSQGFSFLALLEHLLLYLFLSESLYSSALPLPSIPIYLLSLILVRPFILLPATLIFLVISPSLLAVPGCIGTLTTSDSDIDPRRDREAEGFAYFDKVKRVYIKDLFQRMGSVCLEIRSIPIPGRLM